MCAFATSLTSQIGNITLGTIGKVLLRISSIILTEVAALWLGRRAGPRTRHGFITANSNFSLSAESLKMIKLNQIYLQVKDKLIHVIF